MNRIKLAMVSYLNTIPFIKGIQNDPFLNKHIELVLDYPSNCAKLIKNKEVDGGLLPVGALEKEEQESIFTDYCIGTNGRVDTVALFSHQPLNQVKTVFLDYQSRSSVKLVQLLNQKHWHYPFVFQAAQVGFEENVNPNEAILLIGDRVFQYEKQFKYKTDLALAWKEETGLPFVFAVWVGNEKAQQYESALNEAFHKALQNIPQFYSSNFIIDSIRFEDYLTQKIDYHYDLPKQTALKLFKNW